MAVQRIHASEAACMQLRGQVAALFPKTEDHPFGGKCWPRATYNARGVQVHRGGAHCSLDALMALDPAVTWRASAKAMCWRFSSTDVQDNEDKN